MFACRLRRPAFFVVVAALLSTSAVAQGVGNAFTDGLAPTAQSAATNDSWSMRTNPAGLAQIQTFQLSSGWVGDFGARNQHLVSSQFAFAPLDGFVLGGGGQLLFPDAATGLVPFARGTVSSAVGLGRGMSVGMNAHLLQGFALTSRPHVRFDVGTQLRFARWLAFGMSFDNLGTNGAYGALDVPSMRTGFSLRPLGESVTLGVDARVLPSSPDATDPAFYQPNVEVGGNLRVDVGGLGLIAGLRSTGLGVGQLAPDVQGIVGVEVNTNHIGATLLGGVGSGDLATGITPTYRAGVMARLSAESYASVMPSFGGFRTLVLTGEGTPAYEPDGIVEELLSDPITPPQVLERLRVVPDDPSVRGLVLRLRGLRMGWGRAMELRRLIQAITAADKEVICHLDGGGDLDMFVASAASKIYVSPAAQLDVDGLTMQLTYVADALDKVGIRAEAITAGAYKTAPRTFTHNAPSDQEIEAETAILDGLFTVLVDGISDGRHLQKEKVIEIIEQGGLNSSEAVDVGMVDGIAYYEDLPEVLEESVGYRPHFSKLSFSTDVRDTRWDTPPAIAIVPILGDIVQGRSGGGLFGVFGGGGAGADDIIEALHRAKKDDDIKAVVLRIDSPGGDALASDLIWKAVMDVRKEKPVIASMANMAASGGYYIASGANEIFAEKATLTGSIGVFSLFFHGEQLANDLGVGSHEIRRGASSPNMLRGPTDEERARLQKGVDWIYDRFLTAIHEGRGMNKETLLPLAGGRVWTGSQALERKLVDDIGGLADALQRARQLSGVSERPQVVLLSGDDEDDLPDFKNMVRTLAGIDDAERDLRAASELVMGDPALARLLLDAGRKRRTMAKTTVRIVIE